MSFLSHHSRRRKQWTEHANFPEGAVKWWTENASYRKSPLSIYRVSDDRQTITLVEQWTE